jgi:hypothetical protein
MSVSTAPPVPPVPSKPALSVPSTVVVHPLVLLSTVDHYNRVAKGTKKRVIGVLLGEVNKGVVDVTNSYAGTLRFALQCTSLFTVGTSAF